VILAHPKSSATALSAAQISGIAPECIVFFDSGPDSASTAPQTTIHQLVTFGLSQQPNFVEKQLSRGEAKTKLAFYSFSSGTTGPSKVRLLSRN
jgi:hypothetical protein